MEIEYKQFVIVPKRPKMSKGKIASQVAHSTFMALEKQKDSKLKEIWKKNGMCVVVLQCKSQIELFGISQYLKEWDIPHHLYIDEGITEVEMGTPTSLATGILTKEQFWMLSTMGLFK
jgi:peptidyl-tRNA hydrolase